MKNATNVLGSLTLPGPTGAAYNRDRICIRKKVIKMLHGRFVRVGKTVTNLQILGCELHQNADSEEVVQKDCQARKLNREDAMDRSRWKKLMKVG